MKRSNVVIGANYGDEGKGLYVNFFAEAGRLDSNPHLTVRFNGGGQAGHTVLDVKSGKKHIFKHIGSGTFHGAETLLDKMFVVNPEIFRHEKVLFTSKFRNISFPRIFVNENCLVTTPYEILANIIKEKHNLHGSCGVGFGETAKKNFFNNIPLLRVSNIRNKSVYKRILNEIREYTINVELKDYKNELDTFIKNESVIFSDYDTSIDYFIKNTVFLHDQSIMHLIDYKSKTSSVCFEGAQGLGLDMNNEYSFPHVTYSNTGVKNILRYIEDYDTDIHYISRSYLTRHGNGPIECMEVPDFLDKVDDKTNISNEFQGKLRKSILDLDAVNSRIERDISLINKEVEYFLHITHAQMINENSYRYISNQEYKKHIGSEKNIKTFSFDEVTNVIMRV